MLDVGRCLSGGDNLVIPMIRDYQHQMGGVEAHDQFHLQLNSVQLAIM